MKFNQTELKIMDEIKRKGKVYMYSEGERWHNAIISLESKGLIYRESIYDTLYYPVKMKQIYYHDKKGNTIPSKVYKETEKRYLITALDPSKKIWVNKSNCEIQINE